VDSVATPEKDGGKRDKNDDSQDPLLLLQAKFLFCARFRPRRGLVRDERVELFLFSHLEQGSEIRDQISDMRRKCE
jgi:hypothetical protein